MTRKKGGWTVEQARLNGQFRFFRFGMPKMGHRTGFRVK
jgi:hypothetical protein